MRAPPGAIQKLLRAIQPFVAGAEHRLAPDAWRGLSHDEVWWHVVGQVAVVGSSASHQRLQRPEHREPLRFDTLLALSPQERLQTLHRTLRSAGVRYVAAELTRCRKTAALARNLEFLHRSPGGPAGYLAALAAMPDEDERVKRVSKELGYIKLKGARDLMVELGLARDVIALDARVLGILRRAGFIIPDDVQTSAASYEAVQGMLLDSICRPAGLSGGALDRILYQESKQILTSLGASPEDIHRPDLAGACNKMRFTTLDELPAVLSRSNFHTLGFPVTSERTAGVNDPAEHRKREADELFTLTLLRLAAALGPPDYPSEDLETPQSLRQGEGALTAWDFDYDVLILEVVADTKDAGLFRVTLRRTAERHDPAERRGMFACARTPVEE